MNNVYSFSNGHLSHVDMSEPSPRFFLSTAYYGFCLHVTILQLVLWVIMFDETVIWSDIDTTVILQHWSKPLYNRLANSGLSVWRTDRVPRQYLVTVSQREALPFWHLLDLFLPFFISVWLAVILCQSLHRLIHKSIWLLRCAVSSEMVLFCSQFPPNHLDFRDRGCCDIVAVPWLTSY